MPPANAKKNLIEEFKLPEEVAASMCDAIPERYSFVCFRHSTPPRCSHVGVLQEGRYRDSVGCQGISFSPELLLMFVQAPVLPRMAELRWRVDVHISNSILRKKMKPNILMQVLFEVIHCAVYARCTMIVCDGRMAE